MVTWRKKGGYYISAEDRSKWVVKIPVTRNQLKRNGTCGLSGAEHYDLQNKLGVMYVDASTRKFYLIPRDILEKYFTKMCAYSGVKDAIFQYDIKKIVQDRAVIGQDIKDESKPQPWVSDPLVDEIRAKFGITTK